MRSLLDNAIRKVELLRNSGLTIYDAIEVGDRDLWLTSQELEEFLNSSLVGLNLSGLALRSRSKRVKSEICNALGYPIPKSFKKVQPRFLGQKFDIYTQKSNNLQVWNEDLDLNRRYVLIRIDASDVISRVKVVAGSDLAPLDTTGTLTQKYQAKYIKVIDKFELVSDIDTPHLTGLYGPRQKNLLDSLSPIDDPVKGKLLAIKRIYENLKPIVGVKFKDPGIIQERNRGAELHKLVCEFLGYSIYKDNGQFPDIRNQLLEIKLQTSPTVDLGLVSPDSESPLDMEKINNINIRHCDVRYAVFYGETKDGVVEITNLLVTNGKDFFGRLPKFEGKGLNKKIQIPLPKNYFEK